MHPQITSKEECCFKNTVDKQMDTVNTNVGIVTHFLWRRRLQWKIPMHTAKELNT